MIGSQSTAYTRRRAQRAKREQVMVPGLWSLEFVNVLTVHERRGLLGSHQVLRFLDQAQRLMSIESSPVAMADVHRLASDHRLSAYDAAYLELTLRRGLPPAVRDGALRRAALAAGILAS